MKKIPLLFLLSFASLIASAQNASPKPAALKLFFEEAFLHTDRDMYLPGDTLWFKAYLINAQDKIQKDLSKNLYVDLIDPNGHSLNTICISMQNNEGRGDIILPDSVSSGFYHVRAYTNWMRNFGNYFVFEKKIALLQPNKAGTIAIKSLPKIAGDPQVRFFPESGAMIEGVTSVVAVKAEDANGKGLLSSGVIISSAGDTVTRFTCDSLGMGLLALLPEGGRTYTASVKIGSRQFRYPLPAALKRGFALQVKQADTLVHAVINYRDPGAAASPIVNIFVKNAGRTIVSKSVQVNNGQAELAISTNVLPEGICSVILSDQEGKPNCERLFYVHHAVNDKALQVSITKAKPLNTLNVQTTAGARLSMAVIQSGLLLKGSNTIQSQFLLSDELRGAIEQPARYFDPQNAKRFKELDNLLLTQGWRDYVWRRLADSALRISYGIEKGINVSGIVKNEALNKPIPHAHITMFADQLKNNKLFVTETDSLGRFNIPDLPVYGNQMVNLASVNIKGKKQGRIYMDTLRPMPVQNLAGNLKETDTLALPAHLIAAKKRSESKITQLKEVKVSGKRQTFVLPNGKAYMLWGEHKVFNITPKDYEYKTVAWYLMQFTPAHSPQDASKSGVAYMSDGHLRAPILTISDPTGFRIPYKEERDLIYNLPLDKVKKIDVMQTVDSSGTPRYLVALTTIDNALQDNPGTLSANIAGYYQAQTFYRPLGDDGAILYSPRPTISWQPNVKLDATGHAVIKIRNQAGAPLQVVLQGLTPDGYPIGLVLNLKN